MSAGHIYILREREFITGQNVYKIGITRNIVKNKYIKGSDILIIQYIDNVQCVKRGLINKFAKDFIARKDIGSDYFQGNLKALVSTFFNYINTFDNEDLSLISTKK